MNLWLSGLWKPEPGHHEVTGIHESRELAIVACTTDKHWVLGPFVLNQVLPDDTVIPQDSFYPLAIRRPLP